MASGANEIRRFERMATWRNFAAPLAALSITPGRRILDVGCGSGAVIRLIAQSSQSALAVGLDIVPEYVAAARQLVPEGDVGKTAFVVGDACQLPFADCTFDLVWVAFVVEYLASSVVSTLCEFARVSRPGGIVAIFDVDGFMLNHDPIDPDLGSRLERWRQSAVSRGFDPEIGHKLPNALRAAGLRDVRARTFPDPELFPTGRPADEIIEVWEQRLAGMRALSTVFGSNVEAERFRQDFLALLQRDDHRMSGTNWLVWGTK